MTTPIWYVLVLWVLWDLQFVIFRPRRKSRPVVVATNARWGMMFQALGYLAIFLPARRLWMQPVAGWRIALGAAFGLLAIVLASSGIRHLGRQWRMNAALNEDHDLITSGPYQVVRHPIYASMFAMNIMTILFLGRLPWWPVGVVLFILGSEIRVRVEDRLLRERFGAQFEHWKIRVPAYLPLIR